MGTRTSLTVYPGMVGTTENAFINVKNRSHTITANVELANTNTNGVIIAQAGRFGGWTLYMKQGKVCYEYNFFGVERTKIASTASLPAGKHVINSNMRSIKRSQVREANASCWLTTRKLPKGTFPRHNRSPSLEMKGPMSEWMAKRLFQMITSRAITNSLARSPRLPLT